jgi:hypothetical protein
MVECEDGMQHGVRGGACHGRALAVSAVTKNERDAVAKLFDETAFAKWEPLVAAGGPLE